MPARRQPDKADGDKVEAQSTVTAVVLADSFTQKFRPITIERPKVLLPLVNAPMLEYTLEWLALNDVEEIIVVCCAHAEQIQSYLKDSKWTKTTPKVHPIISSSCVSAGDAMRAIYDSDIIKGDFILVSGDTVTNIKLKPILEEHRLRREKNPQAIMTLVMKPIKSSKVRWRLGDNDLLVAIDPATKRLLKYYEEDPDKPLAACKLDTTFFGETDVVQVRDDLMDTNIAICAPKVPMLFQDNFDFQNLRRDFITGVLSEEELGNRLYIHELKKGYATRVHNLRSYEAVSHDVLQRWVFPFVPDTNILDTAGVKGSTTYRSSHYTTYMEQDVCRVPWQIHLGSWVSVGSKTMIGEGTKISDSVVGRNCRIGKDVVLRNCYLHDNVTIHDNVTATFTLICESAVVKQGATLHGSVLSFGVVVGTGHTVPAGSRISLSRLIVQESDDELECGTYHRQKKDEESETEDDEDEDDDGDGDGDGDGGWTSRGGAGLTESTEKPSPDALQAAKAFAMGQIPRKSMDFDVDVVGKDGAGYHWPLDGLDLQRYSLVPPIVREVEDAWDSDEDMAEPADSEHHQDPALMFKLEVADTFLRCVKMRFDVSNVVLELNGLKIAEDKTFADCARYIFTTILNLCLPAPRFINPEYQDLFPKTAPNSDTVEGKKQLLQTFSKNLAAWSDLLQRFLKNQDDQVELLLTFEDYCSQEGVFEGTGEQGPVFSEIFSAVLKQLYDDDIVSEEAFIAWADETSKNSDESERIYLNKAAKFIEWLRTADEEEEDDEDEDD